jgi:hypothetical protein
MPRISNTMRNSARRKQQSGATIIEFTLSLAFLAPLLLGTYVFGFRLVQAQQIDQITRDLAHMYSRGNIDFTSATGAAEAESLADNFGLTSAGQSVVFFSTITLETASGTYSCEAGDSTATCNNLNQPVFIQQIGIGNVSSNASAFGTPVSGGGNLPATTTPTTVANDYNTSTTPAAQANSSWAVANHISPLISLTGGQIIYVVEMYTNTPSLNISGLTGAARVYSRAIF